MPNPRFDECAVIDQDATAAAATATATAKGLARGCCVASSRDCFPQKHWISQWISGASWYEEILIFPQSQEGRKEMLHPDQREMQRYTNSMWDQGQKKNWERRVKKHGDVEAETLSVSSAAVLPLLAPRVWSLCSSASFLRENKNKIKLKTLAKSQTFSNLFFFWSLLVWKIEKGVSFPFNKKGALRLSTLASLKAVPSNWQGQLQHPVAE